MSLKRDRVSIIKDMLELIRDRQGKIKPTQIMYKANLSHQMLKEYLTEVITKEFVIENRDKEGRRTYSLTDKGFDFLRDYQSIKKFFDSYGLNK